jgi:hypothetical protein
VTLDNSGTVTYCACFVCLDRFDLASDFSVPPDAKVDASKFPKINPICVECLNATQSLRSDPDTIPAASLTHTPVRPTQVSTAVLLLCVSLGIDVVTSALSWIHQASREQLFLIGGILIYAMRAWLTYNIWVGRYWARGLYAVFFGLSTVFWVLCFAGGGMFNIHSLMDLVVLYLLFTDPGRGWFEAEWSFP